MDEAKTQSTVFKAHQDDAANYWMEEGWAPGGYLREIEESEWRQDLDPLFEGIKIVDCDTHFTEAPDLWTSYAPAHMKDKMPHVRRVDGRDTWFVGDRNFGVIGGNVVSKDMNKLLGRFGFETFDELSAGSYDPQARVREMDAMGIWAQICFQNNGVSQAGSLATMGDDALAIMIMEIFNDACIDRARDTGDRVVSMGSLPYWDREVMNKEMRRIAKAGIKGITLPDRPERLSEGFLGSDGKVSYFWEEVFDICNSTGIAINFHLNAALDPGPAIWDNQAFDQRLPINAMILHIGCAATMSNFMVSGLLDKYEDLKIGLIESGSGWVPFWLEGMEHYLDEYRTRINHKLKRRPKEYFAKNFWVTFWFESFGPKNMINEIGADRLLFETDYPHPTSLYPGVQTKLANSLGGHDFATRKKVLQDNAAFLFNLDL